MRKGVFSPFVPKDVVTDISTFHGVVAIVLKDGEITREAVSYTHLTLPTIYSV